MTQRTTYRTKARLVEAEQFFPDREPWPSHVHRLAEIIEQLQSDNPNLPKCPAEYGVRTLHGWVMVEAGDWILIDVAGAPYPCKPAVFEASYERVEES